MENISSCIRQDEKISVIIPVYNVKEYLRRCFESVINQTYQNLEIILVDDGSTDGSGKLCDELAEIDHRVFVVHQKNQGLGSARNTGIKNATGLFLSFIDSDDYIAEDMIEKLWDACKKENIQIACCGRYCIWDDGTKKEMFSLSCEEIWTSEEAIGRLLLWDGLDSSVCDKIFSRELFDGICFPEGVWHEDLTVTSQLICKTEKIIHIGVAKYFYYQRQSSITKQAFSPQKMELLNQITELKKFIQGRYPDLKEQMVYFYFLNIRSILQLFPRFTRGKHLLVERKILIREVRGNIGNILRCKYFTWKNKLYYLCVAFGYFRRNS